MLSSNKQHRILRACRAGRGGGEGEGGGGQWYRHRHRRRAPRIADTCGPVAQAFQEVVYSCLAKNPAERPTAQQLLQMRFFKVSLPRSLLLSLSLPPGAHLLQQLPSSSRTCVCRPTPNEMTNSSLKPSIAQLRRVFGVCQESHP